MKFNIGDEIRIIDAGFGAHSCDGTIGIVTDKRYTNGACFNDKCFHVEITQGGCDAIEGDVWRVNIDGKYELIKRPIRRNKLESEVYTYEYLPYTVNAICRNSKGEICETYSIPKETSSYKVIYSGLTTIVIFDDGSKGIARCNPSDTYNSQKGLDIAFYRAQIKQNERTLNQLCGKGV